MICLTVFGNNVTILGINHQLIVNADNTMEIFFYGLFMDVNVLMKKGISYSNPRKAVLNDYDLKIGNRASLIPCLNEKSYGIVMTVKLDEINTLYSEKSVSDYIPEKVEVITESGESINATCYNLPAEMLSGSNEIYARSLYELTNKLEFPIEYLKKIKRSTKKQT